MALASCKRVASMATGSVLTLPAISAHAASNACPITFKASGPNDALSMSWRALIHLSLLPSSSPRSQLKKEDIYAAVSVVCRTLECRTWFVTVPSNEGHLGLGAPGSPPGLNGFDEIVGGE